VLSPEIIGLLREAYGNGPFGGWYREPRQGPIIDVWKNRRHDTIVVLGYPGGFVRYATVRILMPVDGELKTVAECLAISGSAPIHLLCGYRLIDPRHTSAYKYGRRAERWGVPRGK
jgi:hypothetical protein